MKRDMDLVRKIMLMIEEKYESAAIINLKIDGFSMNQVAAHCKLMHEAGLISSYNSQYAGDTLYCFAVGNLTWDGYDYLDNVRDDRVWKKIKDVIKEKGLPLIINTVKQISAVVITSMTNEAIKSVLNK